MSDSPSLRITEIFFSLQGETSFAGLPTVFVRLTGCPMRCRYCDTAYAFQGGTVMSVDAILEQVQRYAPRYVTVTGGEPLAQPECLVLLKRLCDAGMTVSLETGGAVSTEGVDERVITVLDIKTPASGEHERNHWPNLDRLRAHDQLKFVLCDEADYCWARDYVRTNDVASRVQEVLFSPVHGELSPRVLAERVLADRLPVRVQLQQHKLIWGEEPGH
ncbi:MAG TPA: 7-carboxy-7-deazaguanine synthase QueE [Pseudomonadales bacterium]